MMQKNYGLNCRERALSGTDKRNRKRIFGRTVDLRATVTLESMPVFIDEATKENKNMNKGRVTIPTDSGCC